MCDKISRRAFGPKSNEVQGILIVCGQSGSGKRHLKRIPFIWGISTHKRLFKCDFMKTALVHTVPFTDKHWLSVYAKMHHYAGLTGHYVKNQFYCSSDMLKWQKMCEFLISPPFSAMTGSNMLFFLHISMLESNAWLKHECRIQWAIIWNLQTVNYSFKIYCLQVMFQQLLLMYQWSVTCWLQW
jgi:hypothetical protein